VQSLRSLYVVVGDTENRKRRGAKYTLMLKQMVSIVTITLKRGQCSHVGMDSYAVKRSNDLWPIKQQTAGETMRGGIQHAKAAVFAKTRSPIKHNARRNVPPSFHYPDSKYALFFYI
jgi:hypothetical protein